MQISPSCVLRFWIRVFLFLPSTLSCLVIFIFVQPVKYPHGRVRELTTVSTPLDERPNQQNPVCGLFHPMSLSRVTRRENGYRLVSSVSPRDDMTENIYIAWYPIDLFGYKKPLSIYFKIKYNGTLRKLSKDIWLTLLKKLGKIK